MPSAFSTNGGVQGTLRILKLYKKTVLDQENARLGYLVVFSITLLKEWGQWEANQLKTY
jgi:hypothetical protein